MYCGCKMIREKIKNDYQMSMNSWYVRTHEIALVLFSELVRQFREGCCTESLTGYRRTISNDTILTVAKQR